MIRVAAGRSEDVDSACRRLAITRDAGLQWIVERIDERGRVAEAERFSSYSRLPWTLAVAGARPLAARVLSWIESNGLDENCDLPDNAANARYRERSAAYPVAMIAHGAWLLERFGTANRVLDRLRDYQSPATGGAYAERPTIRSSERQDLFPTMQLGMTALLAGRTEAATAAFEWLVRFHEAQPELPRRLYTGWDERGLIVDVPAEEEFESITDLTQPRQAFYNPGMAAAFCGRFLAATGDERARSLGRALLDLSIDGTPAQFDHSESRQICKFGWGAATMLEADPDGDHLPQVLRMAEWFHESQNADGSWHNSPFRSPQPSVGQLMDITVEFVLHVCTILCALEGMRW